MINVRSFVPAMFDEQESSCLMQLSVDDVAVEGETKLIKKCAIAKIVQIITFPLQLYNLLSLSCVFPIVLSLNTGCYSRITTTIIALR